jgi:hypothetical protein
MSLQDWAAIGEIVSGIGVIVSLIYLAYQIGQNTKQMEEQARTQRLNALNTVEAAFTRFRENSIRDPQVASLWRRARLDYGVLTDDEKVQAGAMFSEFFWIWANDFQRGAEIDDASGVAGKRHNIGGVARSAGCRAWWEVNRSYYPPDFARFVDDIVGEGTDGGA